jgi:hypothetical protein
VTGVTEGRDLNHREEGRAWFTLSQVIRDERSATTIERRVSIRKSQPEPRAESGNSAAISLRAADHRELRRLPLQGIASFL